MPTEGFKQLSRQLQNMGRAATGRQLSAAARSAINIAKKEAKARAPVGHPPYKYLDKSGDYFESEWDPYPRTTYRGAKVPPGFSKESVATKVKTYQKGQYVVAMLGVRPDAYESVSFVELGTKKISKRPWLEPAFRRSVPAVDAKFQERLKAIIERASKKK